MAFSIVVVKEEDWSHITNVWRFGLCDCTVKHSPGDLGLAVRQVWRSDDA